MDSIIKDPIAIIGMGCRLPGGIDSPGAYWDFIKNAGDGITEIPSDRWNVDEFYDADPATPGKMYVRAGGFLTQRINEFDAMFFGMSPREAGFIDPQQRLLMEVAWESLEDAGLDPATLAGSDTGVYIGGFMLDNLLTQFSPLNRDHIGSYSAVGSTLSILSNRLSYVFDLRGPSLTIDTACSSSLVAMHEACQAIWRGDVGLALCGGVNVMHRPENLIAMCKGGFLAPDGRSKSFDARANGYGRGEGAGIVVLKPYADAVRDGDRIYALVRGAGVNQDGRTDGITVPNPHAQEALIRRVCQDSSIDPADICYVEAHGTGTPVGDPLEARALGSVIGSARAARGQHCLVGSVKSNIGHLEAASGVAGLIKLALCLKHQAVPPLAHLETPNPSIDFEALGLRLPRSLEPVGQADQVLMAINSFGYGGTNAHAVLQAPPAAVPPGADSDEAAPAVYLLPLSARSPQACKALAQRYADLLRADPATSLADLCWSAMARRGHHEHRAAMAAGNPQDLAERLEHYIDEGHGPGIVTGSPTTIGQQAVFVFTGMGPQWWAMGRELLATEPVFRRQAEACDAIFRRLAGWSILDEMLADEASSRMADTDVAQPANFVLQVSLAEWWRSRGVVPAAIVGHSVGEVSAAYVAGVLDLESALLVSYHRSRIQKKAAGIGGMLAVGLPAADLQPYLDRHAGLSLAAANAPGSVTLAGDTEVLAQVAADMQARGVFNRMLTVEVAYHSHTMEPLKPELHDCLAPLRPGLPHTPLYSTVTGQRVTSVQYDAHYWGDNIRQPVLFERAVASLVADGHTLFLEVGPHPVLSSSIKECLAHQGVEGQSIASLRRGKPEQQTLAEALGGLYVCGARVDWTTQYGQARRYLPLPTYPWQREVHWHEGGAAYQDRVDVPAHALLGRRTGAPAPTWESTLNTSLLPYLPDHRVEGLTVLPGAAYVEVGLALQAALSPSGIRSLEHLEFHKALIVGKSRQPRLHATYHDATRQFSIFSREADGEPWTPHATGRLSSLPPATPAPVDLAAVLASCRHHHVSAAQHYQDMTRRGLEYGPFFQGVRELWVGAEGQDTLARIEAHQALDDRTHGHLLHPTLLDACFQTLLSGLASRGDDDVYVPVNIRHVRWYASPGERFWCHSRITRYRPGSLEGEVTLLGEDGEVLVQVQGIRAQALTNRAADALKDLGQWLYEFAWEATPPPAAPVQAGSRWLVFCDREGAGDRVAKRLRQGAASPDVVKVYTGQHFQQIGDQEYAVRLDSLADIEQVIEVASTAGPLTGIVYAWGLEHAYPDLDTLIEASQRTDDDVGTERLTPALHLMQALDRRSADAGPAVYCLTRQAQPVALGGAALQVNQAPLVGFFRVAINEFGHLRLRLIDVDGSEAAWEALVPEILSSSEEEEVALRAEGRFVSRLSRSDIAQRQGGAVDGPGHERLAQDVRRAPGPGEIEVALIGAPLTASKSAWTIAQGLGAGRWNTLALVVAAGPQLTSPRAGDRVLLALDEPPRRHLTLPAEQALVCPSWPDDDGGLWRRLPLITAYHALHEVAGLAKGEHILIHDAASVLGQAALSVARWCGATIHATVRQADDVAALRRQGVDHVHTSASLHFVDGVRAICGAQGLDVVFSGHGGEVDEHSLDLLGPFGRFLDTSAHGTSWSVNGAIGHRQRLMASVDLAPMLTLRPQAFAILSTRVDALLASGALTAPAWQVFDMQALPAPQGDRGSAATPVWFDGSHEARASTAISRHERFPADASYLITGGFGGFGLALADWLVAQGARHLVLIGRLGAASPDAQAAVARLEAAGASVLAMAADISRRDDVARLFARLAAQVPPLKGIFHAAAVLDDAAIKTLEAPKFLSAMDPKAKGAWLLHQFSQDQPLDHFVLFSSVGSLVGNPGQSTYVAANAFLDALAHARAAQGLVATSINWGALGQVGMAARQKGVEDYLNRMGFGSFTPQQAIGVMDSVLQWRPTVIGASIMDWRMLRDAYPAWGASPRNSRVMAEVSSQAGGGRQGQLAELALLDSLARFDRISALFTDLLSEILRLPPHKLDPSLSLLNMGMDSLMAIEIQAATQKRIGVKVSALELMKGSSITELVQRFSDIIDTPLPSSDAQAPRLVAPETIETPPADTLDLENMDLMLDELSDEDLDRVLSTLTHQGKQGEVELS